MMVRLWFLVVCCKIMCRIILMVFLDFLVFLVLVCCFVIRSVCGLRLI